MPDKKKKVRRPAGGVASCAEASAAAGAKAGGAHSGGLGTERSKAPDDKATPAKTSPSRPATAAPRGGRVTLKGASQVPKSGHMPTTGRYTPPIPPEYRVSSPIVPVLMGILLVGGMLMIVCNYMNLLPGPDPSNLYLLGGLGLITAGFVVATRWR